MLHLLLQLMLLLLHGNLFLPLRRGQCLMLCPRRNEFLFEFGRCLALSRRQNLFLLLNQFMLLPSCQFLMLLRLLLRHLLADLRTLRLQRAPGDRRLMGGVYLRLVFNHVAPHSLLLLLLLL